MKTTVVLDDDVAAAVDRLRSERGLELSEAVNELIRRGMAPTARQVFRQRTANLGVALDIGNVAVALERVEGPTRR
jgi:hypothetical protein